jgi:hypothetical protein
MAEVLRMVRLTGFDPGGEPSIREMSDGSLEVSFEFMPPSDAERAGHPGLGEFAAFDREMAAAAGVPVVWEDREFFRIEHAPPGTLERVQAFVEGYRRRAEPDVAPDRRPL